MYMKKQYKSSMSKNHKIRKHFFFFMVFPEKEHVASKVIFRFCARNQTKHCGIIK